MTSIERREFLKAGGAGFAALSLPLPGGHLEWAFAGEEAPPTLVVIYLRGGMDALNTVVPYADERYHALRPTLAIPAEGDGETRGVIVLDDDFGLHPSLAALKPFWDAGRLAPIVNAGSHHATRSHFDAQDFMEYAAPGLRTVRDGWLNRYLAATHREPRRGEQEQTLRALAMQGLLPRSLRGGYTVLAVPERNVLNDDAILDLFGPLYEGMGEHTQEGSVVAAGRNTFETLKRFREMVYGAGGSGTGAYPRTRFAERLRNLSQVIRSGEGLEVAALDLNGWDTHANQGGVEGTMADLLRTLAGGLAAFMTDLGPTLDRTLILVMTEFGRTCRENGNFGTDHGHGGLILALGGEVRGGEVHGDWAGLKEGSLFQQRDLRVTTDFRDVFAEVLRRHFRFDVPKDFFPDYRPGRVRGLFA